MFTFELIITFDDNISDPLRGTEILSQKKMPCGVPAAAMPPAPPPRLKPLPASPLKGGLPKMPCGVPAAAMPPSPPPRLKPLPASPLKGGLPKMPYGVPAAAMPPAPPPRLKPLPASPLKGGLPKMPYRMSILLPSVCRPSIGYL